uniref:FBD domain-containing protein n=1 Tax=Leersia perrieri TaxID=77586 RepID=A0A0D9XQ88_9ORYZ
MDSCRINAEKMSSPSLKHLSLSYCEFYYGATRTQLSFPSLVSLELDCCEGRTPLILESMPSLVSAIVRVGAWCPDRCDKSLCGDCGDNSCEGCYGSSDEGPHDFFVPSFDHASCLCLKGLLEATHLELSAGPKMYVFRRDLKLLFACNTFAKLKTLVLGEWCITSDLSALIWFLQHSPILEKLTIQIAKEPKCLDAGKQKTPEQPFALNHLKIVEIQCHGDDILWVCKFLKTLGTYGLPLEKIKIKLTNGFNFVCTGFGYN